MRLALLSLLAATLAIACPASAQAAPPESSEAEAQGQLRGRVLVAGTRAPVPDAKIIVVNAPPEVRPKTRAREPLDPATIEWTAETIADAQGRFELDQLPLGKLRVVVMVDGYQRLELWAEAVPHASSHASAAELSLFLRPSSTRFRTEDLPGVARAPGSLGLLAMRGGDPRQTGIYVDGHPVPRAFHVLPIAAVVDPSMLDRVELTPGNFDATYGGFSGGLLELHTRRLTDLSGIHGEAHVDLFDVGAAVWGPVGRGGAAFAFRRAHVSQVIEGFDEIIGETGILVPNYWDYFGRFDVPIGRRHLLSIKAFGAGDSLQNSSELITGETVGIDFRSAFHRFDLGYQYADARLRASLSGALLLDTNIEGDDGNRRARSPSLRAAISYRLAKRATLLAGADFVRTHAWRQIRYHYWSDEVSEYESKYWRFGTWLGVGLQLLPRTGALVIRPQVRLSVFGTSSEARVGVDPRIDVRARVHERVELFAAFGQYSAPFTLGREDQLGLIQESTTPAAHIVVPDWLINYFDPGVETETEEGYLLVTATYQASLGTQIELPWALKLRTTLFWRLAPNEKRGWPDEGYFGPDKIMIGPPRERAYGLELLLDRTLANNIHGMIGYTLLRAETTEIVEWYGISISGEQWRPTSFDQRHNLVALLVFELPRHYRLGARFRLVSGNPEQPVIGTRVILDRGTIGYLPIHGEFGSSYAPLFHQLDVRLDKTWFLRRAAVIGYLDVQNVYNRVYPEIWVYSIDWTQRGERIGLPIFPSAGLRVEF